MRVRVFLALAVLTASPALAEKAFLNFHLEPTVGTGIDKSILVTAAALKINTTAFKVLGPVAPQIEGFGIGAANNTYLEDGTEFGVGFGARLRLFNDEKGYRFNPGTKRHGNWWGNYWVDAHFVIGSSGPGFDVATGYEFSILEGLSVGPVAKFILTGPHSMLNFGLTVTIGAPQTTPAEADFDGDGIRDKDGKPMRFLLYSNDDPGRVALIEQIAADWRAIGVDAVPTPVTFAGLVADFLNPRRFDAALIGWELTGDPDPYPLWHSTQAKGGGQNYTGWQNAEADDLIEKARALTDESERRNLYLQFQDIFAEEVPAILLYHPVYTYGVSTRVHNVQIGSLNQAPERFGTFADWYILTRRVPANQVPAGAPPTPPGGGIEPTVEGDSP